MVQVCVLARLLGRNWGCLVRSFDHTAWPIRQLDKAVGGGFGIMIDDIAAAVFTMVILGLVQVW